MPSFKDRHGLSWDIELTVSAAKRVKNLCGVDLYEALDGKLIGRLASDVALVADVIYCILKPEADARSLTDEQFGESLDGQAMGEAMDAFMEALADFFARPDQRRVVREISRKINATMAIAETQALDRIGTIDPAMLMKDIESQQLKSSG